MTIDLADREIRTEHLLLRRYRRATSIASPTACSSATSPSSSAASSTARSRSATSSTPTPAAAATRPRPPAPRQEAHFREAEHLKGARGDELLFAILDREWSSHT